MQLISIATAGGPEDDGRTISGPGKLLEMAMEMSVSKVCMYYISGSL